MDQKIKSSIYERMERDQQDEEGHWHPCSPSTFDQMRCSVVSAARNIKDEKLLKMLYMRAKTLQVLQLEVGEHE